MFEKFLKCTPEGAAKWEKTRSKGKTRFVFLYGILGFGLPTFLIMTVFWFFWNPNMLAIALLLDGIIWPFAGYWWGASMWSMNEKAYKKYIEQKP